MVNIMVGGILPVDTNQGKRDNQRRSAGKKRARERRKNPIDRRRSVRDGIVVTLSEQTERRQQPERRKEPS
jgi:hypothetical protein